MYQAVHVAVCLCEEPQAPRQLCMHQLLVRIPQVLDTCGEVQAKIGRKERQMVDFFCPSDTSWSMLGFWRRNSGGSGQTARNNSLPSPAISPGERESESVYTSWHAGSSWHGYTTATLRCSIFWTTTAAHRTMCLQVSLARAYLLLARTALV